MANPAPPQSIGSAGYRELYSPLALTAYLAIVAVWFASVGTLAARDPALAAPARLLVTGFTAAFVGVLWTGTDSLRYWTCVAAMAACAYGLLGLGVSGASGILLVLVAAVLAAELPARTLSITLVAMNLALLAIIRWRWGADWGDAVASAAGLASFQAFAALLMRATMRAEQMSQALRASNADLLATRELLAEGVRDVERLRISRELHDVAGHKLTALKLNLAALAREAGAGSGSRLQLSAGLADELLADIRGVVEQLRQDDGVDLAAAMRALAGPFPRPRMQLEITPGTRAGSLVQAEALLRTVQEALTNAARHSQAATLWVVLRREGDRLLLDIRDDGRAAPRRLRPGNGLTGMGERLQALGGGLELERTGTGGVRLMAWLPAHGP